LIAATFFLGACFDVPDFPDPSVRGADVSPVVDAARDLSAPDGMTPPDLTSDLGRLDIGVDAVSDSAGDTEPDSVSVQDMDGGSSDVPDHGLDAADQRPDLTAPIRCTSSDDCGLSANGMACPLVGGAEA
jgi:hypothetical protein